ncbi:hypothetical protein J6590_009081 [Homalodisca vitripennis]|nr:hypothetical protein J6590_009081 [Homalodisca vitripennis]
MIVLISLVVTLLTAHCTATHYFTLRNQLDNNILQALDRAENDLSDEIVKNRGALKLSSLTSMELKPLYFHIDDLAVHVSDMRMISSEFEMEETNLDVLGHRMMPSVTFQWIEVNGKLKTGLGTTAPLKSEFRLMQYHLRGTGVVSLTVDLINVMWSYFYFRPNSTSFEIKSSEEKLDGDIFKTLNSSQFGEMLSKKLQRDISDQLTKVVSKNLNQTLKRTSKIKNLMPYSEEISHLFSVIGVNNTENANTFIDSLLKIGGAMIRGKYGDRIKIPDIDEGFSEKFLVTFRGSFKATQGAAIGASSVYRIGDVVFGYSNDSLLHFYGTLGFQALHLYYDQYKAELWSVGPSGSLDTKLAPLSVLVHVYLNTSSKVITLEKFKITNVGDLDVSLTGVGGWFNWFVSRVTTWVVGLYRDQVLQQLESRYEQYGHEIFSTYSIEELLNDGKNEAYVL